MDAAAKEAQSTARPKRDTRPKHGGAHKHSHKTYINTVLYLIQVLYERARQVRRAVSQLKIHHRHRRYAPLYDVCPYRASVRVKGRGRAWARVGMAWVLRKEGRTLYQQPEVVSSERAWVGWCLLACCTVVTAAESKFGSWFGGRCAKSEPNTRRRAVQCSAVQCSTQPEQALLKNERTSVVTLATFSLNTCRWFSKHHHRGQQLGERRSPRWAAPSDGIRR